MAAAAAIGGRARGAFILLEGVDRCGKSTQATRLVEHLTASGVRQEGSFVIVSSFLYTDQVAQLACLSGHSSAP